MKYLTFALAGLAVLPCSGFSQSMFCGNAAHTGVVDAAGPRQLKGAKWTFKTGGWVIASPAVSGGTAYIGSDDRNLYALDVKTGAEKWKFKTEGPIRSSAAVAAGTVYFGSYDGSFYAVDAETGKQKWRFATDGERRFEAPGIHGQKPSHQTFPDFWDMYQSSPVVDRSTVYFGCGDHHIYALDTATGQVRWKFATQGVVHASPALEKGVLYVGSWDTFFYAIDASTGKEKWRFKTGEDTAAYNQTGIQSSAAVKDGIVYFGCRDAQLYAVDTETGKEVWHFSLKPTWINATPAIHDGTVYFGSSIPTKFYAVDAKTGKQKFALDGEMIMFSSAAISQGMAYVGEFSGTLRAVDLAKGQYAWTFQTDARKADKRGVFKTEGKPDFGALGGSEYFDQAHVFTDNLLTYGSFIGSPTVADGLVIIGSTDGNVYAVE
ncbi:pyrrolo-quinoline quinone [Opitutaceae bacterium EW11]|nr:pyrrolo-quinoline quinone [Opitutaceae bacterium EW11]